MTVEPALKPIRDKIVEGFLVEALQNVDVSGATQHARVHAVPDALRAPVEALFDEWAKRNGGIPVEVACYLACPGESEEDPDTWHRFGYLLAHEYAGSGLAWSDDYPEAHWNVPYGELIVWVPEAVGDTVCDLYIGGALHSFDGVEVYGLEQLNNLIEMEDKEHD